MHVDVLGRVGIILQSLAQTEDIIDDHFTAQFFFITAAMIQLWQALVLVLSVGTSTSTSRQRQFLPLFDREPRSLRDTFPFSQQGQSNDIREDRQVGYLGARAYQNYKLFQNSASEHSLPFSEVASSYAQGKR